MPWSPLRPGSAGRSPPRSRRGRTHDARIPLRHRALAQARPHAVVGWSDQDPGCGVGSAPWGCASRSPPPGAAHRIARRRQARPRGVVHTRGQRPKPDEDRGSRPRQSGPSTRPPAGTGSALAAYIHEFAAGHGLSAAVDRRGLRAACRVVANRGLAGLAAAASVLRRWVSGGDLGLVRSGSVRVAQGTAPSWWPATGGGSVSLSMAARTLPVRGPAGSLWAPGCVGAHRSVWRLHAVFFRIRFVFLVLAGHRGQPEPPGAIRPCLRGGLARAGQRYRSVSGDDGRIPEGGGEDPRMGWHAIPRQHRGRQALRSQLRPCCRSCGHDTEEDSPHEFAVGLTTDRRCPACGSCAPAAGP